MEASVSEAADAFASEAGVQAPPLVDSAALREALQLTGQAARAWARVAAPLVQHAGKGAVYAAGRSARWAAARWAAASARERLTFCATALAALALLALVRWVARQRLLAKIGAVYASATRSLGARSRRLALALPHLLLVSVLALLLRVGEARSALAWASAAGGTAAPYAAPVALAMLAERQGAVPAARQRALEVVAFAAMLALLERVPLLASALQGFARWPDARLLLVLWALMPFTNGAALAARALAALFDANPATAVSPRGYHGRHGAVPLVDRLLVAPLSALVMLRVLPRSAVQTALATLRDRGNAALLVAPALLMPAILARPARAVAALLLPAHATLAALAVDRAATHRQGEFESMATAESRHWLRYWVVLAAAWAGKAFLEQGGAGWLPLWDHAFLLLALWLQLPYFHGADRLYRQGGVGVTELGQRATERAAAMRREREAAAQATQATRAKRVWRLPGQGRAPGRDSGHAAPAAQQAGEREQVNGDGLTDSELLAAYEVAMAQHDAEQAARATVEARAEAAAGRGVEQRAEAPPPLSPTPLSPEASDHDEPVPSSMPSTSPTSAGGARRRKSRKLPTRNHKQP